MKPQWDEDEFSVPIEIKVGTHDSCMRETTRQELRVDPDCSSESSWDVPPSLENGTQYVHQ